MEIIRGKHASYINGLELAERLNGYDTIHIDIGTGDGRYVRHTAQTCPTRFVVGIDACRENLHDISRRASANTLFVIANALSLPPELDGLANHITINFPWGSLLEGLLNSDSRFMSGLVATARLHATIDLRLNGGALADAGWSLDKGANRVRDMLAGNGFDMRPPITMTALELKSFPTTWAKRLAFGRDPRAVYLSGCKA